MRALSAESLTRKRLAVADNPWSSPNTDGFDPSHCTDVSFTNSLIATGDDCIAVKAGYKP